MPKRSPRVLLAPIYLQVLASLKKRVSFLSVTVLEMTFKDDLESLGYVIVHMITGALPWRDMMSSMKPQDQLDTLIKLRNPKTLCFGLPREIS
jgi:hypothetical protein